MYNLFIDFFWPKTCFVCGKDGTNFCAKCLKSLPVAHPKCLRCGAHNPMGIYCSGCRQPSLPEKVLAGFSFEGELKDAIHQFKYEDMTVLSEVFSTCLARAIKKIPAYKSYVLVPVPLHPKKLRSRGYNQAQLLAREAAEILSLETSDLLIRKRLKASQVTVASKQARKINVKGIFAFDKTKRVPARVMLIDDTVTTGATIEEATKTLKHAGVCEVIAVALALGGL